MNGDIALVLLLLSLVPIATVVGLILAAVALARSRRINELSEKIDSLEKRVRVMWLELMLPEAERHRPEAAPHSGATPTAAAEPRTGTPPRHEAAPASRPAYPRMAAVPPRREVQPSAAAPDTSVPPIEAEIVEAEPIPRPLKQAVPSAVAPQVRAAMAGEPSAEEGWEAVVGGSWLNKIGVLVLVVGIALFIGYSLTQLGPGGRLAVGFVVSFALLGIGIALEPSALYRIFARGLAAGGWAGLYFTTYAMHGLAASRVIESPTIGLALLIAVAAGMIAHALYFRLEAVTALAYFFAFVAIAISPISLFAAIASVVLVATLLAVAHRYNWDVLAVSGVVLTYGTFGLHYRDVLFGEKLWLDFTTGHVVLAACWLLFEAFDIAVVARGKQGPGIGRTLLPLNACGFLGLSLLLWGPWSQTLYVLLGATAVAYLASSVIRAVVRPVPSFAAEGKPLQRALLGGYEAAITLAAALAASAIWQKYDGWRINVALLIEGEFLFLAGLILRLSYLRALATAVFSLALVRFVAHDLLQAGEVAVYTLTLMQWTPLALLMAAVFYVNRALLRPTEETFLLSLEKAYSYAATALVALVLGFEMQLEHRGIAWLALSLVLLELALRVKLLEFRVQTYLVGTLAIITLLAVNGFLLNWIPPDEETLEPWIWLLPALVALYAAGARLYYLQPAALRHDESLGMGQVGAAAASGMLALLLWHGLPAPLVAVGWGVAGLLLIQVGFHLSLPALRWHGYAASGLVLVRLFMANFANPGETLEISHRLLTVGPIVVMFYYLANWLAAEHQQGRATKDENSLGRLYLYVAALVLVVLLRFELGRVVAVLGWAAYGLVLLYVGIRIKHVDLRWQSYLIALLTFARSWATNFYVPEGLAGPFSPVVTGSIVVGCLYVSQLLSARRPGALPAPRSGMGRGLMWLDAHARGLFCVLATVLLAVLLWYEVEPRVLTASWGIQGAALLVVGFVLRDRAFRLAGLGVMAVCLPKLFFFDLRELETGYRIFSFILLGLLLIAASWIYTRFREQLRVYL
jgi:predicted membrane protein DUF2339